MPSRVALAKDGEIVLEGPTVAESPLHTGDLGRWEPDGRLTIAGRNAGLAHETLARLGVEPECRT